MKKIALVTGASGAIGASICRQLAHMGYFVWVHYHTNKEKAVALAKEIEGNAISANLRCHTDIQKMFDTIGHVDVLVNNAGCALYGLLTDQSVQETEDCIALNLTSAIVCAKAVIPAMVAQKSGVILNISSIWGQVGASCEVTYSAAKAGLIGFTKALSKELAPAGVRVNCIAPGAIDTNMLNDFSDDERLSLCREIPLGRIGNTEDVAHAVTFLVSDRASYITGETLSVNGGWL